LTLTGGRGARRHGPHGAKAARSSPASARGGPHAGAARALVLALLAASVCLAFAGVLRNGWILLDDPEYVTANPTVQQGWTLSGAGAFLRLPHAGNWHPLTSWSHMLDVQAFGLAPAGPHAVSLALHALNAVLLAWVLFRLTGGWWRSVLVAGFFALHPLRVESVAWVAERKDVLSTLFFLLTIEAYRRWAGRPTPGRYAAVALGLALGLMSKPMVVTLPCVLVLLDVWPLGRLRGLGPGPRAGAPARPLAGLLREKAPLFALSAASAVITFLVQRAGGAVAPAQLSLTRRLANALVSYLRYVGLTAWPRGLSVYYPYGPDPGWEVPLLATLALALVTGLVWRAARRRPYLAVGWLWYLGTLVPVIGLVQVGMQAYADRYTYVPTIGLLVALVWGGAELAERSRGARVTAVVASVVALAVLALATGRQVAYWRDTRTLFAHALAVTPDNAFAHQGMGNVLLGAGDVPAALAQFQEAMRLEPGLPGLRANLGSALGALGRYEEAIGQFQAALRRGESASLRYNLGSAFAGAGRLGEAIREYEGAARLEAGNHAIRAQLAAAYAAAGRRPEAMRAWDRAIGLAEAAGDRAAATEYARRVAQLETAPPAAANREPPRP
jgi:protein O-mannosyl-transferase